MVSPTRILKAAPSVLSGNLLSTSLTIIPLTRKYSLDTSFIVPLPRLFLFLLSSDTRFPASFSPLSYCYLPSSLFSAFYIVLAFADLISAFAFPLN
jgi:hypothetical protein